MAYSELVLIGLGILAAFIAFWLGRAIERVRLEGRVDAERADAVKRSRAVLTGMMSEQVAPYLPDFPFSPTEVRFVGKPIDFIAFTGLDGREPSEVVFVEVKSGNACLSATERKLKDVIERGKVRWELYRMP